MSRRPLRTFAYGHPWFYDLVSAISSLPAGGPQRLRSLCAQQLVSRLSPQAAVLDLCCGGGAASAPLLAQGFRVTGLDCSPQALERAARSCPGLVTVEGLAEEPPLEPGQFAGVQISLALHEFHRAARLAVLAGALRLLEPGGWFVALDLHHTRAYWVCPSSGLWTYLKRKQRWTFWPPISQQIWPWWAMEPLLFNSWPWVPSSWLRPNAPFPQANSQASSHQTHEDEAHP